MRPKSYVLPIEVEALAEGGYLAECSAIQGCHAEGDTIAEAVENILDVARVLLELRGQDGLPMPPGLRLANKGMSKLMPYVTTRQMSS